MNKIIYLDNNATTLLDPSVKEFMLPLLDRCLNPSSIHGYGKEAKRIIEKARDCLASYLKVLPEEITFTSGGTESLNTLIKGLYPGHGKILSTMVEHACIYETLLSLNKKQDCVTFVPVGRAGAPNADQIEALITKETTLMVFSAVYSETGSMLDLDLIASLAKKFNIPLIIDGVALLGKFPIKVSDGISAVGFSSHKLHGPKGVGAFFLRRGLELTSILQGGNQERGKRAGTEAVEAIAGFGKAVEILNDSLESSALHMETLRNMLEKGLSEEFSITINGLPSRICNISNVTFHDIDGETLLIALERQGIYASLGSACSSGAVEPSRILLNMGLSRKEARSSIRFSLSRMTTIEEIQNTLKTLIQIRDKLLLFI